MSKDEASSSADHARLMRENMLLTQEINELRREYRYMQSELATVAGSHGPDSAPALAASLEGALEMSLIDIAQAAAELGLDDDLSPSDGVEESKVTSIPRTVDALDAHLHGSSGRAGGDTHLYRVAPGTVTMSSAHPPPHSASLRFAPTGTATGTGFGSSSTRRTAAKFGVITSTDAARGPLVHRPASSGAMGASGAGLGNTGIGLGASVRSSALSSAGAEALRSKLAEMKAHE